jgi:hypothetical protein
MDRRGIHPFIILPLRALREILLEALVAAEEGGDFTADVIQE